MNRVWRGVLEPRITLILRSGMHSRNNSDLSSAGTMVPIATSPADRSLDPLSFSHVSCATSDEKLAAAAVTAGLPAPPPPPPPPKRPLYSDWEIRALVLPLVPLRSKTPVVEILRHLPLVLRNEMEQFPGGAARYLSAKFHKEIISPDIDHVARSGYVPPVKPSMASSSTGSGATSIGKSSPPPPPPPPTFINSKSQSTSLGSNVLPSARGFRSPPEVLDAFIEYIPTFFVDTRRIVDILPPELSQIFGTLSFVTFLRKYRFYFDMRAAHSQTEVRVRQDVMHPKRGFADFKFAAGIGSADVMQNSAVMNNASMKRPPRNSEANLIMFLAPKIPSVFTPIGDVLSDISEIVAKHPSYDPRLGISGLFEKFPEYFQVVDGKIRIRPFRVAPYALDEKDITNSPHPVIFDKVLSNLKGDEWVETSKIFALLEASEKLLIKDQYKTFPRFLRLHGREVSVAADNMKVKKFTPENEKCADTLSSERLAADSLSPDDPILNIPAVMAESVDAEWAVKELYDAMPLMQCVEVNDLLDLVTESIRNALPKDLAGALAKYPDYFTVWASPDDPAVFVVQRAKLVTPDMQDEDIARIVLPLIPQGGIDREKLLRKVPLQLQRFLSRHGVKTVLGRMPNYFLVVGDKVMRVC